MNRLDELNKLNERLEGTVIFKKTVWLIMDKTRKVIAKGVPRNRYLCLVDDITDRKRVLTYNSEGMAKNGFISSGFYHEMKADGYLSTIYGNNVDDIKTYLEPVKAIITIKI